MYNIIKKIVKKQELTIIEVKQKDIEVSFMDYGATILNILIPDKNGVYETILMEYEELSSYIENPIYLNAIIGPTSGRIKDATFKLNGKEYVLDKNHLNMANLHGGSETFAYKVFDYQIIDNINSTKVIFTLHKKKEESKYPGNQIIEIIYTVEKGQLMIEFNATTDEDTLLNLTNHAYFNLSGNLKSKVLNHELYLNSSNIVKLDQYSIPYKVENILNTNLDYKKARKVYSKGFSGIDHPFLIDVVDLSIPCVIIKDEISKRALEVYTNYECFVCYTHEYPDKSKLLSGIEQIKNMGICFETQHVPNGINIDGLEDSILKKDDKYSYKTIYKFSIY